MADQHVSGHPRHHAVGMVHPPSPTIVTQRKGYRFRDVVGLAGRRWSGSVGRDDMAQLRCGKIGTMLRQRPVGNQAAATGAAIARHVHDDEPVGDVAEGDEAR